MAFIGVLQNAPTVQKWVIARIEHYGLKGRNNWI